SRWRGALTSGLITRARMAWVTSESLCFRTMAIWVAYREPIRHRSGVEHHASRGINRLVARPAAESRARRTELRDQQVVRDAAQPPGHRRDALGLGRRREPRVAELVRPPCPHDLAAACEHVLDPVRLLPVQHDDRERAAVLVGVDRGAVEPARPAAAVDDG